MIPAQRSGATPAESQFRGHAQHESLIDNDAVGVATVGDAAQVLVGRIEGECQVRAEILEASPAFGAGAVGVDEAAYCGQVSRLEFRYGRTDLGHSPNNFVARDNRIHGWHEFAPLVAHRVQIRVADTAE